jgi:hypothetical protein
MDNDEEMMQKIIEMLAKAEAKQEDTLKRIDKMDDKMAEADKQEEMLTEINAKTKAILEETKAR